MPPGALGAFVRRRWGRDILCGPLPRQSHGTLAWRRYGVGGARAGAAAGFPHVYRLGLPAWQKGDRLSGGDGNAAGVQTCFALMARVDDTNLLHRSGAAGLHFARQAARGFLARGGVGQAAWSQQAAEIHREFVARRLSPISRTLHWSACLDACRAAGVTACLELGPGHALAGMIRPVLPQAQVRGVDDFRTPSGVTAWLQKA